MKRFLTKFFLAVILGSGVVLIAQANTGKAALKAATLIAKKIKPNSAAKIAAPAARPNLTPAIVPLTTGLTGGSAQTCGTCNGTGRVVCLNCNCFGQVFVTSGWDMFGNPTGQWMQCPICSGTKQRPCPTCR